MSGGNVGYDRGRGGKRYCRACMEMAPARLERKVLDRARVHLACLVTLGMDHELSEALAYYKSNNVRDFSAYVEKKKKNLKGLEGWQLGKERLKATRLLLRQTHRLPGRRAVWPSQTRG